MPLHLGDRFELTATGQAWDGGQIPLRGGFRYLLSPTGEPVPVTFRGDSGRLTTGVWDGRRGVLELSSPGDLDGTPGSLTYEVGLHRGHVVCARCLAAGGRPAAGP